MNEDQMTETTQNTNLNNTNSETVKPDKTYTWDIMQEVKGRAYKKGYTRGYEKGYRKAMISMLGSLFNGYHIDISDDKFIITKQDTNDAKKSE